MDEICQRLYSIKKRQKGLTKKNSKKCIRVYLRIINDKIDDPKALTEKVPKSHGYGNITRVMYVYPEDIKKDKYSYQDVIDLIRQSYHTTQ